MLVMEQASRKARPKKELAIGSGNGVAGRLMAVLEPPPHDERHTARKTSAIGKNSEFPAVTVE